MKFQLRSKISNTSKLELIVHHKMCRDKMYVKVYGTIRVFKEEKAIVGTHIKRIEKFEIKRELNVV